VYLKVFVTLRRSLRRSHITSFCAVFYPTYQLNIRAIRPKVIRLLRLFQSFHIGLLQIPNRQLPIGVLYVRKCSLPIVEYARGLASARSYRRYFAEPLLSMQTVRLCNADGSLVKEWIVWPFVYEDKVFYCSLHSHSCNRCIRPSSMPSVDHINRRQLRVRDLPLPQQFLTWGPRTSWGSMDRFQGVRELG
jgi:hypothetical protein